MWKYFFDRIAWYGVYQIATIRKRGDFIIREMKRARKSTLRLHTHETKIRTECEKFHRKDCFLIGFLILNT